MPSRLVSGRLRRPFLGPFSLPLRLLCDRCVAGVRPAAHRVPSEHSRALLSAFAPSPELFSLVHAFKYGSVPELAAWFGARLARLARHELRGTAPLVVPVPLHAARQHQRGFNQSALLAHEVGRRLGWPVHDTLLVRRQPTPPLARLPHAARRALVQGAFVRRMPAPPATPSVVLVDDIVTTGATSAAAIAALGLPPERSVVLCLCAARAAAAPADVPGL